MVLRPPQALALGARWGKRKIGLLFFSAPGSWTLEPKWSCEERFDSKFWECITKYTPH